MDLQLAQDKVEAAGLHNARAEDASGRGRGQFQDQEWVVVDQSPAAGTKVRPGTEVRFSVLAYGDRGAPPPPDRSRSSPLPHLTCFDLQEAEDTLQSAGFADIGSADASGKDRRQFADRNWTVTGQHPAPGGDWPKSTRITLRALKDGEVRSCR
jgi:beta-lactam-binding protein with PASTA domain